MNNSRTTEDHQQMIESMYPKHQVYGAQEMIVLDPDREAETPVAVKLNVMRSDMVLIILFRRHLIMR